VLRALSTRKALFWVVDLCVCVCFETQQGSWVLYFCLHDYKYGSRLFFFCSGLMWIMLPAPHKISAK
jgi:hypothetical protein